MSEVKQARSTEAKLADRLRDSGVPGDLANTTHGTGPTRVKHHVHSHGHAGPVAKALETGSVGEARKNVTPGDWTGGRK